MAFEGIDGVPHENAPHHARRTDPIRPGEACPLYMRLRECMSTFPSDNVGFWDQYVVANSNKKDAIRDFSLRYVAWDSRKLLP